MYNFIAIKIWCPTNKDLNMHMINKIKINIIFHSRTHLKKKSVWNCHYKQIMPKLKGKKRCVIVSPNIFKCSKL